jgi:hypothetical protein
MDKYTYEVFEESKNILRSDGAWIPMDEANSDYQRYLNPQAEQFTPIVEVE